MPTTMTGSGIDYNSGLTQTRTRAVIKHRMTGATTVDQVIQSGGWDFVNGAEIDMGVPQKSTNWYRIEWYSDSDDWGGTNGGVGYALYRNTPSSGWERILDSGWHANYDANMGDYYVTTRTLFYAPVHQTYPTQVHTFRIYARRHPDCAWRINASIGADYRHDGWQNALMEVWELDSDLAQTPNLTRY
jgi:hypothetical protein